MRIAVLDERCRLVDSVDKKQASESDVECGDLPCDGRYEYRDGQFFPVGYGRGKPTSPGTSPYQALAMLIRSVENGTPLPQECIDWADWHDKFGGVK